jgi:hypothetical protein
MLPILAVTLILTEPPGIPAPSVWTAERAQSECRKVLASNNVTVTPAQIEAIWTKTIGIHDATIATLTLAYPQLKPLNELPLPLPQVLPNLSVPTLLKTLDPFTQANASILVARQLCHARGYEEATQVLASTNPTLVVEPALFDFYRGMTDFGLHRPKEATASLKTVIETPTSIPERYRVMARLMTAEMARWPADAKNLSTVARLMDTSSRRLDLAKGDRITQDVQKKIVFRLDELIKEAENQKKKKGQPGDGSGDGEPGDSTQPSNPASDSNIMGGSGAGKVDDKKLKKLAEEWGKLPASERAKAIQEMTRDLPPKYKQFIEDYFKSLNKVTGGNS